jgi:hypothetical protein
MPGRYIVNIRSDGTIEPSTTNTEILGYDTIAGTSITGDSGNTRVTAKDTAANTGTITSISLYGSNTSATLDIKFGLYGDTAGTPGALLYGPVEYTDVGTWSLGWKTFSGLSWSVSASTIYYLAFSFSETSVTTYYDLPGGNQRWSDFKVYGGVWSDPLQIEATNGWLVSIYATIEY